ncbi:MULTISPECIES: reverse transcriptase-like protein [unclassified Sphingomonas]|uniref:reverse transcriptase-like protein n=1 Tax=unclassified Sphingomonas TaxID=196159 RepID=UPI0028632AB7|nr:MULTISPECIES: reverse transcriptase-like protein [unclassified Sphingomonas]MDR6114452.1 ribonuclease HI [Sphingomonas sp. SORGH_AS_0789]MDR6148189.1 ribonuclease HI [Sphingomonas sp. SORGH_AS_0742]
MKIFFDGGLRPTGLEWAVVMGGHAHVARMAGPGDSMDAEWLALIAATRLAHDAGLADALLLGDSLAVIGQASGRVRVPPAYRAHHRLWSDLPRPPGRFRLRHIRRTQNLAGIALAKPWLYPQAQRGG